MKGDGAVIARKRKLDGMSQQEVASKLGMSTVTIRRIEDDVPEVGIEMVARVAESLGMQFDWTTESVVRPAWAVPMGLGFLSLDVRNAIARAPDKQSLANAIQAAIRELGAEGFEPHLAGNVIQPIESAAPGRMAESSPGVVPKSDPLPPAKRRKVQNGKG